MTHHLMLKSGAHGVLVPRGKLRGTSLNKFLPYAPLNDNVMHLFHNYLIAFSRATIFELDYINSFTYFFFFLCFISIMDSANIHKLESKSVICIMHNYFR